LSLIEAKGIYKSFQKRQVLKGVDLQVNASEIIAIVGASGAGKTSFLNILGTLESPDQGSVFILGQEVLKLKSQALSSFRNKHIGFIFQFHNLLPELNALENICLPAWLAKKTSKEIQNKSQELMDILGISSLGSQLPSELSGGEQQRVAVARALINAPTIVLADEPSGNLDKQNAQELHQLFLTLKNDLKQTFVIVTHNEQLATMADKKLTMVDGILVDFQNKELILHNG